MRLLPELALGCVWLGMLIAMHQWLGPQVALFAVVLGVTWFAIVMVLSSRPPGIPEFVSDEVDADEQHVIRRDVIPKLPWNQRLRLSLSTACGACLLLWLTLTVLRGE